MPHSIKIPPVMKAVFIEKPSCKLVLKETIVPVPGPGQVLVKIAAAPVNPSDLARIHKACLGIGSQQFIPGIEGIGTVAAAGKGLLPHLWLGKRIACSSAYDTSGTWAEYMLTPAGMCFPTGNKITDEQGSMMLVNPLTALAFIEIAIKGGHRAIINNAAASALGRMLELLSKRKNIAVINIVRRQEHAEMLRSAGSQYVLNSSDPSFIKDLGILSGKLQATLFLDTVCNEQLTEITGVLPPNSTVVIYGNRSGSEKISVNPRSLMDNNIKIEGFYLADNAGKKGILRNMMDLIRVRRLMSTDFKIKIREKFPLGRAQEAIDVYTANMSEGKILLVP